MNRVSRFLILPLIFLLIAATLQAAALRIDIGRFSRGEMTGWEAKSFKGETNYTLVDDAGTTVLEAESHNSASGLFREVGIDLKQTPILNWSWKTAHVLSGNDERSKQGDDYPARVYVVFSGGLFFWKTRAINYVWSSHQPVGTIWPNAYTGNARMIAVESGAAQTGRWLGERRNVLNDFRMLFDEEPGNVDAVAIMTDTDNSGQSATARYGDIWFSMQ